MLQADSLRSNCRHELLHAKKILQDLEFCFVKEGSISNEGLLNGGPPRMCPQVKQILQDCLQEKSLVLPATGEKKEFDTWYTRYSGYMYHSSKRRELAQESEGEASPSQTIIMAVGVTAFITFFVAGLLFYLCFGTNIGSARNDERPLLSLSLSDNSIGSYLFLCLFIVEKCFLGLQLLGVQKEDVMFMGLNIKDTYFLNIGQIGQN